MIYVEVVLTGGKGSKLQAEGGPGLARSDRSLEGTLAQSSARYSAGVR